MPPTTARGACGFAGCGLDGTVPGATRELGVCPGAGDTMGLWMRSEAAATATTAPTATAVEISGRLLERTARPVPEGTSPLAASTLSKAADVRAHRSRGTSGVASERNSSWIAWCSSAAAAHSGQVKRWASSHIASAGSSAVSTDFAASIRARSWIASSARARFTSGLIVRPSVCRRRGEAVPRREPSPRRRHRWRPRAPSPGAFRRRGRRGGFHGHASGGRGRPRG